MTTAMAACISMTRNADRLTLTQLLSSAFPVGAYAYSQGLEQAITDGHVTDPASLKDWITAVLTHGSARSDAILLAHARSSDDLTDLAYAYAPSAERHTEMREQGAAFGQVAAALIGPQPALPYALAIGHATRTLNLPTAEILALYLHSVAAQLISAAVRFVPLGAADGQKVLHSLAPLHIRLAEAYAAEPLTALTTATLGADLAQMRHETLPVRIYRS
ncbi:MAG: urease accessory UreF family protein [bacterium]